MVITRSGRVAKHTSASVEATKKAATAVKLISAISAGVETASQEEHISDVVDSTEESDDPGDQANSKSLDSDHESESSIGKEDTVEDSDGDGMVGVEAGTCTRKQQNLYYWDRLPGEVKNKIYRFLMKSHKQLDFEFADFKRMNTLSKDFHLSGQMLRCSKQICSECQPILYGENVFRIHQNMHDFFGKDSARRRGFVLKIAISTRAASKIINKARKAEIKKLKNLNEIIVDGGSCKENLIDLSLDEQEDAVKATFEDERCFPELKGLLAEHLDLQKTYVLTGQTKTADAAGCNKYAEFKFDIVSLGDTDFGLILANRREYTIEKKTGQRIYLNC